MAAPLVLLRWLLLPILLGAATGRLWAQELPKKDGFDFDFEPKLMLNDLPDLPLTAGNPVARAGTALSLDVEKLAADFEKAKKTAAWRERLCKAGVLSKFEAEQAVLKTVRIERDLEIARLQATAREVEAQRRLAESDENARASLAEAEARLATATTVAATASARWDEAQRAAAELRLQRERRLLAGGAGSRSAVKRAEAALQSLMMGSNR